MIPQDVPAAVARLQDDLLTPQYALYVQHLAEAISHDPVATAPGSWEPAAEGLIAIPGAGRVFCETTHHLLNVARLFHVSEPMAAVARVAAEKLPPDAHWEQDSLPSRVGILFFQTPLLLLDVWNRPVNIAAAMWSWHFDGREVGETGSGWVITLWSDRSDIRDYYIGEAVTGKIFDEVHLSRYLLFSTSWLREHQPVGDWYDDNVESIKQFRKEHIIRMPEGELPEWDHNGPPSTINFGRINYTIMRLMEGTVANVSEYEDRRLARRNRGKSRPSPQVTVIELRRYEDYGYYQEGSGTFLTYRSVTSGHFRRVHTREGVKRVWVNAYWRGPANAPIRQPARVNTLKR